MIAVDTNVLVRHFVADDPRQAEQATRVLAAESVYVSNIVLAELAWVLDSCYEYTKDDIVEAMSVLLQAPDTHFASRSLVGAALEAFQNNNADFADWLIYYEGIERDCSKTVSFDRKCLKTGLFKSP